MKYVRGANLLKPIVAVMRKQSTALTSLCAILLLVITGSIAPSSSAYAAAPTPEIKSALFATNGQSYCFDDLHDSAQSGDPVYVRSCDGSKGEHWFVDGAHNTLVHIDGSTGFCLSANSGSSNGTIVVLRVCNSGGANQIWHYDGRIFKNPQSGKCLTVQASNFWAPLMVWDCGGLYSRAGTWYVTNFVATPQVAQPLFSGYSNPFHGDQHIRPDRIDQGVDYLGTGQVYPIGEGEIEGSTRDGGWPNGIFIRYKLLDGVARGIYIYVAEDCNPEVSLAPGTKVSPQKPLCYMWGAKGGIETGFARSPAYNDIAMAHDEYASESDGVPTNFGVLFSDFMMKIGAPGGLIGKSTRGATLKVIDKTPIPPIWSSKL